MDNSYYATKSEYQGLPGTANPNVSNKLREIGICDRVQGLNSGLRELNGRLCSLLSRLNGVPHARDEWRTAYAGRRPRGIFE
jgi:hypothetical protein